MASLTMNRPGAKKRQRQEGCSRKEKGRPERRSTYGSPTLLSLKYLIPFIFLIPQKNDPFHFPPPSVCDLALLPNSRNQREAKFMQNMMIEVRYYNISRLAILLGIIIQGYCELNYIKLGNLFHFYWDLAVDLRWRFSCQYANIRNYSYMLSVSQRIGVLRILA